MVGADPESGASRCGLNGVAGCAIPALDCQPFLVLPAGFGPSGTLFGSPVWPTRPRRRTARGCSSCRGTARVVVDEVAAPAPRAVEMWVAQGGRRLSGSGRYRTHRLDVRGAWARC